MHFVEKLRELQTFRQQVIPISTHARSRFARSTVPEEKWGLLVVY